MALGFAPTAPQGAADTILDAYRRVRAFSDTLSAPLSAEDQQVQSMPDVSPTKWHLAHTTWFFETFLLIPHLDGYRPFDPDFAYLFNSYYEALGERMPRPERGLLTRPSLDQVWAYRRHVDAEMARLLSGREDLADLVTLGLNHEQQHQELLLMDIKHVLSLNPLSPAYQPAGEPANRPSRPLDWIEVEGGLIEIGEAGDGFAFDNERPRHKVWLERYRLADRLVTNAEWRAFIDDGGYRRPELWLSEGWATAQADGWSGPLYWRGDDEFTLHGQAAARPDAPVCHVSFYEADAFARWAGKRLPTEAEWEHAAADADSGFALHPAPAGDAPGLRQMTGAVWQWTASPYVAYPRYRPEPGALGEYNGKFMSNQMVLRGGACVTPTGHSRRTYRNFYPPAARWAFGGVRLADDA